MDEKEGIELTKTLRKTNYLIIGLIVVIIIGFGFLIYFQNMPNTPTEMEVKTGGQIKTGYFIQNLKGESLDIWFAWSPRDILELHIVDSDKIPKNKLDIIEDVIFSDQTLTMDNSILGIEPKGGTSKFWFGWKGVCDEVRIANGKKPLVVTTTEDPSADIVVKLTNQINADGFSGYTTSIVDTETNEILRTKITIFEVDTWTDDEFAAIMRHEMGHAVGLSHSTDPSDLMFPSLENMTVPYISECDVEALVNLYSGGESSKVVCSK